MTKRTLKHLGLCLALALLCAALWGLPGMAEDLPAIEGLGVRMGSAAVDYRDEADIYFDEAYVLDDEDADIDYALTLLDITGGREFQVDIAPANRCFTVPVAGYLEPGHGYRAIVTAMADGCAEQSAQADFVVTSERSDFRVELDVEGERNYRELRTCEEVFVNIHAPEALEVQFGNGHGFEEDFTEEGAFDISFPYFWDYETSAAIYVRARFADPDDPEQDIWIVSNPVTLRVTADDGLEPLPAPVFTEAVSVLRGDFAEFSVGTEALPGDLDNLRLFMQVYNPDDYEVLKDLEFWPGDDGVVPVSIITADLQPGEYALRAAWRAVGRVSDYYDEASAFTVEDNGSDEPIFAAVNDVVVPHEGYEMYAYFPGAQGLCVYEDWEIREIFEGADGFTWSDGDDRCGQRSYYLGVWNAETESWERRDDLRVDITIYTEDSLPEPIVDGLSEDVQRGVLYEGDGLSFTLRMAEVEDPGDIWYDVRVEDTTDGYDLMNEGGIRLYPDEDDEDDYDPSYIGFELEGGRFAVGHSYCLRIEMRRWGYPTREAAYAFVVAPRTDDAIELLIDQIDEYDGTDPNVMHELTVNTDGATALQLYWDNGWQNVDPGDRDEDSNWHWAWTLDNPGRQTVVARATWDDVNWDEGVDWDGLNWTVYSEPWIITVYETEAAGVPAVTLSSQSLTRGETLTVTVGPAANARAYSVNIMAPNDEGEFYDFRCGDYRDLDEGEQEYGATFVIPTVELPAGEYRVRVDSIGEQGYVNSETDYHQPDLYFTLDELEADVSLTSTGAYNDEYGYWDVPVHEEYIISGYARDARALCLYEDGEMREEW